VVNVQTRNKSTGANAALKQVQINDESDLDDFVVEIDILMQCKHRNVIELYEAYLFNRKLMVCYTRKNKLSLISSVFTQSLLLLFLCVEIVQFVAFRNLSQTLVNQKNLIAKFPENSWIN